MAKYIVGLLGTTKQITAADSVGYFLVVEHAKELVLILAKENKGGTSIEFEIPVEQRCCLS